MMIEPKQASQAGNLYKFFMPLIEKQEDIRKHIQLRLPQIQQLAQANFEFYTPSVEPSAEYLR